MDNRGHQHGHGLAVDLLVAQLMIQDKERVEVTLTLDIPKHGRRFHDTMSPDIDTGLKHAMGHMRDLPHVFGSIIRAKQMIVRQRAENKTGNHPGRATQTTGQAAPNDRVVSLVKESGREAGWERQGAICVEQKLVELGLSSGQRN